MTKKVVLISHYHEEVEDRVTRYLRRHDMAYISCSPFNGDSLPQSTDKINATVLFGGAQNVDQIEAEPYLKEETDWIGQCIASNIPVLGLCLGAQLIAHALGARVAKPKHELHEFGFYPICPTKEGRNWISGPMRVPQSHYYGFDCPDDATLLATGEDFPNQAFVYNRNVFAFQFHPEVTQAGFRSWQDADWADWNAEGAQSREEQNQFIEESDRVLDVWFDQFMDRFFAVQ